VAIEKIDEGIQRLSSVVESLLTQHHPPIAAAAEARR